MPVVPRKSLHIAWVAYPPEETGGVPGVAKEVLEGLVELGHRIDSFRPGKPSELPRGLAEADNFTTVCGTSGWKWNRWYSRTRATAYVSSKFVRMVAIRRLRKELARRHREDPYDLIYQGGTMSPCVPPSLLGRVPLVSHPQTHFAGELKFLVAERHLAFRCQPFYIFAVAAAARWVQTIFQRRGIRRANLLIGISSVLRDQIVADYDFPFERTVVIPSAIDMERFEPTDRELPATPTVIVVSRVIARKGIEDVVALARLLRERDVDVRFRIVGGTSVWSNYTKLLEDLPAESSEYIGGVPSSQIPSELARSDLLLLASKYEPFGLVVSEALASGIPAIGTSAVGAIEGVDSTVATVLEPGDVAAMATAITEMLDRVRRSPAEMRSLARAEAERLFAPEVVCEQISTALERLVDRPPNGAIAAAPPESGAQSIPGIEVRS
jgi:glycosyltransferase involved in cell wall biosynthesis